VGLGSLAMFKQEQGCFKVILISLRDWGVAEATQFCAKERDQTWEMALGEK